MRLLPTEEQVLIRESARRLFAGTAAGDVWAGLARDGWLELIAHGVGSPVELSMVMTEAGRAGATAPLIDGALIPGGLLAADPAHADTLRRMTAGEIRLGHTMQQGRPELEAGVAGLRGTATAYGAGDADSFVVAAREAGGVSYWLVPSTAPGVAISRFDTLDGGIGATLVFDGAMLGEGARIALDRETVAAVEALAVAASCAQASGNAGFLVDETARYASQREQFGKPIASFQAVGHRLARMRIATEEMAALAALAALRQSAAPAERDGSVSVAKFRIGLLARMVSQSAVQLHGGMGVSEELSVGSRFRQSLAFEQRFGSTGDHRALVARAVRAATDLSASLTDGMAGAEDDGEMTLALTKDDLAFREKVRGFLDRALGEELRRGQRLNPGFFSEPEIGVAWNRILGEKGWAAPAWPVEFGGTGWTLTQRHIWDTETARAGAPYLQVQGLRMIGPVIQRYGSPEQRAFYLPRILSGEDYWCQGYSEPGAGSDLAALKTRAVRDGDHYVVNGSKIWTTHAHHANRMFGLFRTSSTGDRRAGITFLLLDMDMPGIEVRPIITMDGEHEVNEVFFKDVRVPVANRLGEEDRGWDVAKYLLEFERGGGMASGELRAALNRAHRLARALSRNEAPVLDDPGISARMAGLLAEMDAYEMLELTIMTQLDTGQNPGPVSSILRVRVTELRQAISELTVDIVGERGLRWYRERPLLRHDFANELDEEIAAAAPIYLSDRAHTIFAGSTEIQLSIIARSFLH